MLLQGASQVGKTTLALAIAQNRDSMFVSLDDDLQLDRAKSDPAWFVQQAGQAMLVIDEVQRAPNLVLALKSAVDSDRRPGRFLLTGSVDLFSRSGVADSLAGRVESLIVQPLSAGEKLDTTAPEDWVHVLLDSPERLCQHRPEASLSVVDAVLEGGFPEPIQRESQRRKDSWYRSYLNQLTDFDPADGVRVESPQQFAAITRLVAARGTQELVKAKLARQINIAETTLPNYLAELSRMHILTTLPAWGSAQARIIRRPKIGLRDTGLAASLTQFNESRLVEAGGKEYFGSLLELFVANELAKQRAWSREYFQLYHFRSRDGHEVDIVIELDDARLIAVEVKAAIDPGAKSWAGLVKFRERFGDRVAAAVVLHQGTTAVQVNDWLHVLPVTTLWDHALV